MGVKFTHSFNSELGHDVIIPIVGKKVDTNLVKDYFGFIEHDSIELSPKNPIFLTDAKSGKMVILLGLGEESDKGKRTNYIRSVIHQSKAEFPKAITIIAKHLDPKTLSNVVMGCFLGIRQYGIFKTNGDKGKNNPPDITILIDNEQIATYNEAVSVVNAKILAMELVDLPSNIKTPYYLADKAEEVSNKFGIKTSIIRGDNLVAENLHALHEVGKGSSNPPAFITMEYIPENYNDDYKTIVLVGKGITFDTGGISIKPSANLANMKSDMGGAAAVMGVLQLVADQKVQIRVIGIIPAAENAVDGSAYKPSDVIQSYSGKTIEVIDTDAEGRVVLADGLAYGIKNYKPDYVIDLATLTGSCIVALGYLTCGMFTKSEKMSQVLRSASEKCDERVWPMPMWDEYAQDMQSDIADIKNLSAKPVAGSITAAKFLEAFTDQHPEWVHLDIAGVSFADTEFAKSRIATGYGVSLVFESIKLLA
ncbi:MAG: leucyl aminopeptidase family protein [Saprospiraceae bacterium]